MLNKLIKPDIVETTRRIFATATLRQSGVTFGGTVVNGALGAIFYILAARFLGPAAFGILSVAIATLTLVSDIGDLGTDTGLVRFVGKYLKTKPKKADRFLKLGLKIKIAVSFIVLILGWILAPTLAVFVFSKPELIIPLRISFLGVGSALLFSFTTHTLQAFQKFWSWSGIHISSNLLRVFVVLALLAVSRLDLNTVIISYIATPFVGFLLGMFLIPRNFYKVKNESSVASEFFQYNKWVAAFTLIAAFGARLDTFISARLLSSAQLGIYSAANRIVQIVPQIVGALGTVIAPKMASMGSITDLAAYIKKTQLMVVGLAFLGILSIPVVLILIPIIFGPEYVLSGPIFVILLFAMLIFLISVPVHMAVFYYFAKPSLFFWLSAGHLAIIAALGWNLISTYGPMGAAVTVLVGQIFNFIIPAFWVLRKIRRVH